MSVVLNPELIETDAIETKPSVALGVEMEASRLDRLFPGWHMRVDGQSLVMSSCSRCVLGQLGGFSRGWEMVKRDAGDGKIYAAAYSSSETKPYWIEEINKRL